jgi:aspartyl-tRNA(Asn)/glutamyl-tRNA(Gln) amidotransferase subunit A
MDAAMKGLDLFVGSRQLLTNRTGHPVLSLPSGFHRGMPTALHFTGQVLGEEPILRLAHAFQDVTDHHRQRPPLLK